MQDSASDTWFARRKLCISMEVLFQFKHISIGLHQECFWKDGGMKGSASDILLDRPYMLFKKWGGKRYSNEKWLGLELPGNEGKKIEEGRRGREGSQGNTKRRPGSEKEGKRKGKERIRTGSVSWHDDTNGPDVLATWKTMARSKVPLTTVIVLCVDGAQFSRTFDMHYRRRTQQLPPHREPKLSEYATSYWREPSRAARKTVKVAASLVISTASVSYSVHPV